MRRSQRGHPIQARPRSRRRAPTGAASARASAPRLRPRVLRERRRQPPRVHDPAQPMRPRRPRRRASGACPAPAPAAGRMTTSRSSVSERATTRGSHEQVNPLRLRVFPSPNMARRQDRRSAISPRAPVPGAGARWRAVTSCSSTPAYPGDLHDQQHLDVLSGVDGRGALRPGDIRQGAPWSRAPSARVVRRAHFTSEEARPPPS